MLTIASHDQHIHNAERRIKMELDAYFENQKGRGILATADDRGKVDVAVYARPHVMEDGSIAFIMGDRLSHHNLHSNAHAAYLFMEEGAGYKGVRLFLTKVRVEENKALIEKISRRRYASEAGEEKSRFLVYFKVDKVLPLVGTGESEGSL